VHGGVGFAAQLAHGFYHFGDAAPVGRMVVAQTAPVGIKGQPAFARNQIAFGDERPGLTLFTKPQVFQLQQHHDGEVVVDGSVFHVVHRNARFVKRQLATDDRAGGGRFDITGPVGFNGFARAAHFDQRARQAFGDFRIGQPVMPQQSSRCSGVAIMGELTTS